ncbi:MAG: FHA domain-containing protein [Coriobacteriales bacterium]|nr:FHA domain-containing protein [Coriobacteriales bacterium]
MFCTQCGARVTATERVCPMCGSPIGSSSRPMPSQSSQSSRPRRTEPLALTFVEEGDVLARIVVDPNVASRVSFGRSQDNDVVVSSPTRIVSGHHGVVVTHDGWCVLTDAGSANGLWFKGTRQSEFRVANGDVAFIGKPRPGARRCVIVVSDANVYWVPVALRGRLGVAVGRTADNDVMIADATISTRHAFLHRDEDSWVIEDLNSTNGTQVDGQRVGRMPRRLSAGSKIVFGNVCALCAGECLLVQTDSPPQQTPHP